MTYQPRRGDYGVLATKGIPARLIQIGDLSPWNHVIGYIGKLPGFIGEWIVEASPRGVRLVHLHEYDGIPIAWNQHEPDVTDEQRDLVVEFLLGEVGKPYGFGVILAISIRKLGLRLPKIFTLKLAKSKGYICSELLTAAWRHGRIVFFPDELDEFVTPRKMAVRLIFQ